MIALTQLVLTTLSTDSTLLSLLGGTASNTHIYTVDANKFEVFPCMTWKEVSAPFRPTPINAQDITLEFHIYTKTPLGSRLDCENIYSRVNTLLNYKDTAGNKIHTWSRQTMAFDQEETDRQLFHKIVRYQFWSVN